jgi:hypothetical protein
MAIEGFDFGLLSRNRMFTKTNVYKIIIKVRQSTASCANTTMTSAFYVCFSVSLTYVRIVCEIFTQLNTLDLHGEQFNKLIELSSIAIN